MENIDINEILRILPHRYPFVLIDKITSLEKSKNIVAIKNVTINEQFFQGHFPGKPTMPGVLIIEAMAQAAAMLVAKSLDLSAQNSIPYLVGIDKARFRRVVEPGDVLTIDVSIVQKKGNIWIAAGKAQVGEELAAESSLMAAIKTNS